jgi:hypothetical protein
MMARRVQGSAFQPNPAATWAVVPPRHECIRIGLSIALLIYCRFDEYIWNLETVMQKHTEFVGETLAV